MGTLVKGNRNLFPTIPSLFDEVMPRDWLNWPFSGNAARSSVPAVNVRETKDTYELEVAAPGMNKQNFMV